MSYKINDLNFQMNLEELDSHPIHYQGILSSILQHINLLKRMMELIHQLGLLNKMLLMPRCFVWLVKTCSNT